MHSTSTEVRPVHLGGATLERSRHVCAFVGLPDEEYRVLLARAVARASGQPRPAGRVAHPGRP
jgi:hypothetical protein